MKKSSLLCLLSGLYLVFASLSAFSEEDPVNRALSELIYEKDSKLAGEDSENPFRSTVAFSHINGFIESSDRINRLSLTGSYGFKKTWFSLAQVINHHYFRNNSNDKGVWIQDAILSVQKEFKNFLGNDSSVTAGVSSTLPFSHYSQVNDIWTVSTAYLVWSLKLDSFFNVYKPEWIKNITFYIKPIARYYFSEYTTTPTEGQSLGGAPLPQFLAGIQNLGLRVNITDRFSLAGSYGRWVASTYKIANDDYNLRHFYLFLIVGSLKIHKQWNLSFSYSHIDRVDKPGRTEFVVLDNRLSSWSVTASYSFSFNLPYNKLTTSASGYL